MLKTPILAAALLALVGLASLTPAHATTQTTTFNKTITFDDVTVTISATFTLDTTAKTLTGTASITAVNNTSGATILSKTFNINLSFSSSNTVSLVITSSGGTLAISCFVSTGSTPTAVCTVSKDPDLNHNGLVDFLDASTLAYAYGSSTGSPRYNAGADLNADGRVDILDASLMAMDYSAPVFQ